MIRRHARTVRLLLMVADATVAMLVLLLVSRLKFGPEPPLSQNLTPWLLAAYAMTWVVLLGLQGLYKAHAHWSIEAEARGVIKASALLGLITLAGLFLADLDEFSRIVPVLVVPVLAAITIVTRSMLRSVLRAFRRRGRNLRHVLIVGTGPEAVDFATRLEDHWELGFIVTGFVGDPDGVDDERWDILGPLDTLPATLHDTLVDEVVVCLPGSDPARLEAIARLAMDQGKTVRFPLALPLAALSAGHVEDLDGTPVVSIVSGPDRELALAVKRLMDIAGAVVGLIVLSPLLVGTAVVIKLSDGGPVLFRQPRAGLHGRPFSIAKFRTMVVDADAQRAQLRAFNEVEGNASFKMANDPRITRLGRFLRKTSIDEFPQLWNVLRGEMSLVGPRPHPFDDVAGYDDWHRRRLSMKPGMTGLWQIGARTESSFDRWVEKDLEYIDRWSLWLDFRVIAGTIPAILRTEGR